MERKLGREAPTRRAAWASEWMFLVISAILFVAAVGSTIAWNLSMSGGMQMPGGWTLPMAWVKMPEQTWPSAVAAFMGMWIVMMAAMMLPSLTPMLLSYRRIIRMQGTTHPAGLTALAGAGYFCVWAVFGVVVYAVGAALAAAEMQWMDLARLAPAATGAVLVLAGVYQLTGWKARQLGSTVRVQPRSSGALGACGYGLRLGLRCSLCCAGLMLILLATGVTDLRIMAMVAVLITVEEFAPRPERVARAVGVIIMLIGAFLIAQALPLII